MPARWILFDPLLFTEEWVQTLQQRTAWAALAAAGRGGLPGPRPGKIVSHWSDAAAWNGQKVARARKRTRNSRFSVRTGDAPPAVWRCTAPSAQASYYWFRPRRWRGRAGGAFVARRTPIKCSERQERAAGQSSHRGLGWAAGVTRTCPCAKKWSGRWPGCRV